MPTPARISDLLNRDDHERLLQELVRPETPLPLSSRLLLTAPDRLPTVARAISLVRLIGAGYRPSGNALRLASRVVEDARAGLEAPIWDASDDGVWATRAASLVALEAWGERMALLTKLGVTLNLPGALHEASPVAQRLSDALASWLHAQLASDEPLEATPARVTLLWLLSERPPAALADALDRLQDRLDAVGTAHHPSLGTLFVQARYRRDRAAQRVPAIGISAA